MSPVGSDDRIYCSSLQHPLSHLLRIPDRIRNDSWLDTCPCITPISLTHDRGLDCVCRHGHPFKDLIREQAQSTQEAIARGSSRTNDSQGGFVLPIGLFWFACTSSTKFTFWPQVLSGVFIGAGTTSVFFNGLLYIVDVYLANAASGLAANSLIEVGVLLDFLFLQSI